MPDNKKFPLKLPQPSRSDGVEVAEKKKEKRNKNGSVSSGGIKTGVYHADHAKSFTTYPIKEKQWLWCPAAFGSDRGLVMTSYYSCLCTCKMGNISSMYMTSHSFSRIFWIPPSSSDLLQHAFFAQISPYILATEVHGLVLPNPNRSLSRSIVQFVPIRTLNTYGTMGLFIYFIYLFATRTQSYYGVATQNQQGRHARLRLPSTTANRRAPGGRVQATRGGKTNRARGGHVTCTKKKRKRKGQ